MKALREVKSRGVLNIGVDATLRYFYKDVFSVGGNLSYMNLRNKEEFTETGRLSAIYNDELPNMRYLATPMLLVI